MSSYRHAGLAIALRKAGKSKSRSEQSDGLDQAWNCDDHARRGATLDLGASLARRRRLLHRKLFAQALQEPLAGF